MTNPGETVSDDLEERAVYVVRQLRQRAIPGLDTLEGAAADVICELLYRTPSPTKEGSGD